MPTPLVYAPVLAPPQLKVKPTCLAETLSDPLARSVRVAVDLKLSPALAVRLLIAMPARRFWTVTVMGAELGS